jgi:hypothetical protein
MPSETSPHTPRQGLGAAPAPPSGQDVHQKGRDSHYGYHDGYNGDGRDGDNHVVRIIPPSDGQR